MTSQAPRSTRTGQLDGIRARAADRDTRRLTTEHPVAVDAYGMLDHRTRESTLIGEVAPPGRYLAVEHDGRTRLIALTRPITHIGRGLVADVRLEDAHVSRRHAIIAIRGDGPDAVRVLDDRSSGGTFVNGNQVTVAALHDGDIVRFGPVAFRYTEVAPQVKRRRTLRRIPLTTARWPRPTPAVPA